MINLVQNSYYLIHYYFFIIFCIWLRIINYKEELEKLKFLNKLIFFIIAIFRINNINNVILLNI